MAIVILLGGLLAYVPPPGRGRGCTCPPHNPRHETRPLSHRLALRARRVVRRSHARRCRSQPSLPRRSPCSHALVGARGRVSRVSRLAGGYEKYVLRVPNEKAVATTRVELHFPAGIRVTSFAEVPGWQLEVVTDSAKAITAAIWTGTLAAATVHRVPVRGGEPEDRHQLDWPAFQTYADGERVEWTGPEGLEVAGVRRRRSQRGRRQPPPPTAGYARWLPWVAVVLRS